MASEADVIETGCDNIVLSAEDMFLFIDAWEENECLWQTSHPKYKSRPARTAAQQRIAQLLKDIRYYNCQVSTPNDLILIIWYPGSVAEITPHLVPKITQSDLNIFWENIYIEYTFLSFINFFVNKDFDLW